MYSIFISAQLIWLDVLIAIGEQPGEAVVNSRSIFITAVEDEERIRFPEEVLLIQLIAAELQHHRLLKRKQDKNKSISPLLCRDADHSSCGYDEKRTSHTSEACQSTEEHN